MSKEIFIVYVTYLGGVELTCAFETKESAEAKCFELSRKWVSEDSFDEYLTDNKITQISLDTFNVPCKFKKPYLTSVQRTIEYPVSEYCGVLCNESITLAISCNFSKFTPHPQTLS